MECFSVEFSSHAFTRMFQREIVPEIVVRVIKNGETIATYPDDKPYSSSLVLGFFDGNPIHVVVAQDPETKICYVVTVYRPDESRWGADFRTRRVK